MRIYDHGLSVNPCPGPLKLGHYYGYRGGHKEQLGCVSKAGQVEIRRPLIVGAISRLNWPGRKSTLPGSWLSRILERKPKMLVAIALANEMARTIWAVLTNENTFGATERVIAA